MVRVILGGEEIVVYDELKHRAVRLNARLQDLRRSL